MTASGGGPGGTSGGDWPQEWADHLDPFEPDPPLPTAERAGLNRIRAVLADEATWDEPPGTLRSNLLARAAQEQAAARQQPGMPVGQQPGTPVGQQPGLPVGQQPGMPVGQPPVGTPAIPPFAPPVPPPAVPGGPIRPGRIPLPRRRLSVLTGIAAAAAAAIVVTVLAWPRPATSTFPLAGTRLAPSASAAADLEQRSAGMSITLHIEGLGPAPAGSYYAAWLRGPTGVVPLGSFHWHKGGIPIQLWSGVSSDRYPDLFVTLQREGEPPNPTGQIVLEGQLGR